MTLPPPEPFNEKEVSGILTDRISLGKCEGHVALVLQDEDDPESTLVFRTSSAGARQVAASLLNLADDLDEYPRRRRE